MNNNMFSKLVMNNNIISMSINNISNINNSSIIKRCIFTNIKKRLINNNYCNSSCILKRNIINDLRDLGSYNY